MSLELNNSTQTRPTGGVSLQVPQLSLSNPLPPVVGKQVSIAIPQKAELDVSDVKEVEPSDDKKPFILACSRPLKPEETELLKSYGQVLIFHDSFRNIPLSQHQFDYGVFDLMEKVHRDTLAKEDLTKYHVVCIVGTLDTYDDFASDLCAVNCVRTFPARQAFKSEFDRLLLAKKVRKPSTLKSFVRFLCFLSDGLSQ